MSDGAKKADKPVPMYLDQLIQLSITGKAIPRSVVLVGRCSMTLEHVDDRRRLYFPGEAYPVFRFVCEVSADQLREAGNEFEASGRDMTVFLRLAWPEVAEWKLMPNHALFESDAAEQPQIWPINPEQHGT